MEIDNIQDEIKLDLLNELNNRQNMLSKLNERIFRCFTNLKNECQNLIRNDTNDLLLKLSILESRIQLNNNKNITLYSKSNKKISSNEELEDYIGQIYLTSVK